MDAAMRLRSWCFLLGIFICSSATGLRAQRGPWEIIKITENLYRTRSGAWYGLFYVTPDGILLADPISSDFADGSRKNSISGLIARRARSEVTMQVSFM